MAFPLEGLRILDFSRVVAGPFATRMLCDLGADVVKVEPPEGDLTRLWGARRAGLSGFFVQQNAGKRNICVDMKSAGAASVLLRLVEKADVVVENYRPGVLARLGLGYEQCRAVNPSIVMLSISGFGQESSWRDRAAYAPIIHAESGLLSRQSEFDNAAPTDPILSIADFNAALHGLVGLLSALWMRERTGRGQHIDLAMLNAMVVTDDYAHFALDDEPVRRLGGRSWVTGYGHILISGDERALWYQLNTAGLVDDGLDPDATLEEKIQRRQAVLEAFFASYDDRDQLERDLDKANVAWADIRDQPDLFSTPVAQERRLTAEIDDRAGGTRRVVESPYRFSDAEAGVRAGPSFRGEHNAAVLTEWLGLSTSELASLTDAGILLAESEPE